MVFPGIGDCDAGLNICGCVEGGGLPVTASSGATVGVTKEPGFTGLWKGVNFLRCCRFRIVTRPVHTDHILVILSYLYPNACSLPSPKVVTNQILNVEMIPNLELL